MLKYVLKIAVFFTIICSHTLTYAGPWFTGPLLAPAGHTVPGGHSNVEIYGLDIETTGQFDGKGKFHRRPDFKSKLFSPIITHGYTEWLDVQFSIPYAFNSTRGKSYNRLTDTAIGIGLQVFDQKKSKWLPDLRFMLQETIPTGKYMNLNPAFFGADATGLGSYRTLIGLNFQYLSELYNSHYLRTRLILSRLYSSSVNVDGLSAFGGTFNTHGNFKPGNEDRIDLAFELTLTQNWVAVMEGYISEGQSTHFNGILDVVASDVADSPNYCEHGLAPALEYNFNPNIGIIGGVWFPVKGKNTSKFTTYVIALNAFW